MIHVEVVDQLASVGCAQRQHEFIERLVATILEFFHIRRFRKCLHVARILPARVVSVEQPVHHNFQRLRKVGLVKAGAHLAEDFAQVSAVVVVLLLKHILNLHVAEEETLVHLDQLLDRRLALQFLLRCACTIRRREQVDVRQAFICELREVVQQWHVHFVIMQIVSHHCLDCGTDFRWDVGLCIVVLVCVEILLDLDLIELIVLSLEICDFDEVILELLEIDVRVCGGCVEIEALVELDHFEELEEVPSQFSEQLLVRLFSRERQVIGCQLEDFLDSQLGLSNG